MRLSRPAAAVAALVVVVGLAGCAGTAAPASSASGSSSASSGSAARAAGQRIEVQVSGGQATGDNGRVAVPVGEHVTLVVTSDVADEVHLHGYDKEAQLTPGQPTEISFDATIPGVFEVELHEAGTTLLSLQVG